MSGWEAYVNSLESITPAVKRVAIIAFDGKICAKTSGKKDFKASPAELKALIKDFDQSDQALASGVNLENVHYIIPRADERLIFGKRGKMGLFASKTKTAVIIVVYEGDYDVSSAVRKGVEKVTNHLMSMDY
ncbi:Profilin [Trichostrongylus colubriformis]|uniref:Profilin n=1 Tax=Trichostrongylus colubriformis TaxID=6319 RepID=A0AAN8FIS7_TRICO